MEVAGSTTTKDEGAMYMIIAITETRKRVAILCLLSFLALC